jgi:5-hydroxyisourate hydrolase
MSTVSTHVLDTSLGRPGRGIAVRLERLDDPPSLVASGDYFAGLGTATFFPEVQLVFTVSDQGEHYHVPVLLSPFAYSTYRGS